jgi:hypothetical protein
MLISQIYFWDFKIRFKFAYTILLQHKIGGSISSHAPFLRSQRTHEDYLPACKNSPNLKYKLCIFRLNHIFDLKKKLTFSFEIWNRYFHDSFSIVYIFKMESNRWFRPGNSLLLDNLEKRNEGKLLTLYKLLSFSDPCSFD